MGVPGPAQGPARRRRPRLGARVPRPNLAVRLAGRRPRRVRRGRAGDATPGPRPHPGASGGAPAQARLGRTARRRVRRTAPAARARPGRRAPEVAEHLERAVGVDPRRLRRPRRRRGAAQRLRLPAHPRAPDPAAPASADARRARGRRGVAPARSFPRLRQAPGRGARQAMAAPPARGAPSAREALLPSAAQLGCQDLRRRGPALCGGRRPATGRPGLPGPGSCAAPPGGDVEWRESSGGDPAHPATGDARLVRGRARPRCRTVRVPQDQRVAGRHSLVPPAPPRRGRGGGAAGPAAGHVALRDRPAPARASGRPAAGGGADPADGRGV